MKHKSLLKAGLVLAMVLAYLPFAHPAQAALLVVTNTDDSGSGSLRMAIIYANMYTGSDTIAFDIPTSDSGCNAGTGVCTIQPGSALPALSGSEITIDGYTQDGAAQATDSGPAVLKIVIDGSNAGTEASGLTVTSANNTIRGLVINNFDYYGIHIDGSGATGNTVSGNYIGTDVNATTKLGNGWRGVHVSDGAQNNTIGGDSAGERNVISGNGWSGISIWGSDGNILSGNYIGTNASGTTRLGNDGEGVYIADGAQNNTVGGDTEGERNLISGNDGYGVWILDSGTMSNTISGNYIGTDISGTSVLSNTSGVRIDNSAYNTIGGGTAGERNLISGNDGHGIYISGGDATGNVILGNTIGLAVNGTDPLGNGGSGVYLYLDSQNTTIGGGTAGERNVISNNGEAGITIFGSNSNTVSGNYIGTDASGTLDRGNTYYGVWIRSGAQSNTVGPGNVIAHNDDDGVNVNWSDTTGNAITQNSIFSNMMGINLKSGANGNIAAPLIITTTQGSVNIVGTACAGCTVEVFENSDTDGEGETYVGDTVADGSGNFTVTVSSLTQSYLTATATDEDDGTSEFSDVFEATVELVPNSGPVYLPIVVKNN
jgi:parallel beta-helix repeat protein